MPTYSQGIVTLSYLYDIADAIREKTGYSSAYALSRMASAIRGISGSGSSSSSSGGYSLDDFLMGSFGSYLYASETYSVRFGAFRSCYDIEAVNFPNVERIESYAFESCYYLSSTVFSDNLYEVGDFAFRYCDGLSAFHASNLESFGVGVFSGCYNLSEVTIGSYLYSFPSYTFCYCNYLEGLSYGIAEDCGIAVGAYAFAYCCTLSDFGPMMSALEYIGPYAFCGCSTLEGIDLPSLYNFDSAYDYAELSSESAGGAFAWCEHLSYAYLPNVTVLPSFTFAYCSELQDVSIPYVNEIADLCFLCCTSLVSLEALYCERIGRQAFAHCDSLSTVALSYITEIDYEAFYDCIYLSELYLACYSVPSLARSNAFANCGITYSGHLGHYGSIYVFDSMYSDFVSDSKWSYFSSRIVPLTHEDMAAAIPAIDQ